MYKKYTFLETFKKNNFLFRDVFDKKNITHIGEVLNSLLSII